MVTYRKDLARKHWHRPWPVRIVLVVLGLVLVLAGLVGWSLETEYGGDPDRAEFVVGHDAETGLVTVYGEDGEPVYESTDMAGADAYVDSRRGDRNYTVPVVLLTGGALSIILGVLPSPLQRQPGPVAPAEH